MTLHVAGGETHDFDFSGIFIAREQQLDQFRWYLARWKDLIAASSTAAPSAGAQVTAVPSPNNPIQGFLVLLYGRGGFGKSTLLKRYHDMAREPNWHLAVSEIIDWEFALDDSNRSIFNPPPGQEVDAGRYFRVLCARLAEAPGRSRDQFREYARAVAEVEQARKQASDVIESLQKDDRYAWLRKATSQEAIALVRTFVPAVNVVPGIDTIAGAAQQGLEQGMKFGAEQARHLHEKLRDKMGQRLDDCLDPALKLGASLGRDLARFARDYPLLICFDTYEIVDEGDRLLRIVMKAAGVRVGWVIAGRDNLWAGVEQRKRSLGRVYGYKDIVQPDRALAIDFNVGSIGAFTASDILTYFTLLSEKSSGRLAAITEEDAERLLDVTQGVPLAVKIAAALYWKTADLHIVTAQTDGKRDIVDQMVQRYLQHAGDDQHERARLYGLALLRRADRPEAIAAALGIPPEQADERYEPELSRLHRRYSFVFTEKAQPTLHQEVRHFLRLWLLEDRRNPLVVKINERIKAAHEAALKKLEERWQDGGLKERMKDDEWVSVYLDLVEQQYWLDCAEGVRCCLPFMLAAAIYRRNENQAAGIGKFFEGELKQPYRDWWKWAAESLVYESSNPFPEELHGLEALAKLASQRCPTFPAPVPDYRAELEAALWWRLGEAYLGKDDGKALEWYEKALTRLGNEEELKDAAARICYDIGYKLYIEKEYDQCLPSLNRAAELKPDYTWAYNLRGLAYAGLKDSPRAIADYDRAIELDPSYAIAYYNRGTAYADLKDYARAITDYDRTIELDPKYADAYFNRGLTYLWLKNSEKASADFEYVWKLKPTDVNAEWMAQWATMGKERAGAKQAERLEQIAAVDSQRYASFVCRGVALGLRDKLAEGLAEIEQAIPLEPEEPDAYFWKGMIYAYLGRNSAAVEAIEKALEVGLPPVLLMPLYWLERDRPGFFGEYAGPLLERYGV
jgi:tetratricopeptide (TPR) repeat protein